MPAKSISCFMEVIVIIFKLNELWHSQVGIYLC